MNNGSTTDDQSTTTETTSTIPVTSTPAIGSAGSVVLDLESGVEAESRSKLPSSKFKGVVPQPNGRWGAQIYEKHQRVWLGTFNEESEAARAYDTAVVRFRGGDAVTNLKPVAAADSEEAAFEASFLNSHSKAEIVDMLRKHTYNDELEQSRRAKQNTNANHGAGQNNNNNSFTKELLFEKVVTPSDVGKLNRLVIPKQHAEKHFPLQIGTTGSNSNSNNHSNISKGVLLHFEDITMKVWRFRYSYWNSSQSYVLTKGWSRFVKDKNLTAGDIVRFQRSTGSDKQLYIDWKTKPGSNSTVHEPVGPVQMFRLFGVDIFSGSNNNGKRSNMEMVMGMGMGGCKKQRVVGVL